MSKTFQRIVVILVMAAHVPFVTRAQPNQQVPEPPPPALGNDVPGVEVCWQAPPIIPREGMIYRLDINGDGVKDFIFGAAHKGKLTSIMRSVASSAPEEAPYNIDLSRRQGTDGLGMSGRSYKASGAFAAAYGFGLIGAAIAIAAIEKQLGEGDSFSSAMALDGKTGEKIWEFTREKIINISVLVGNDLVIASSDNTVCRLNAADGESRWCVSLEDNPVGMVAAGNVIAVAVAGTAERPGKILGLSFESGEEKWAHPADFRKMDAYERVLWLHEGKIYAHAKNKKLQCVDVGTGKLAWQYETIKANHVLAISKDAVFVSDTSGFHRLHAFTGEVVWTFKDKKKIKWPQWVWGDAEHLVWSAGTAMYRKNLIIQEAGTGEIEREVPLDMVRSLSVADHIVLAGGANGTVGLRLPGGEARWTLRQPAVGVYYRSALQIDRTIYMLAAKGITAQSVAAVDADTGYVKWQKEKGKPYVLGMLANRSRLWVFRENNNVEVLNPKDGESLGHADFKQDIYFFATGKSYLFSSPDGLWCLAETQDACPMPETVKEPETQAEEAELSEPKTTEAEESADVAEALE